MKTSGACPKCAKTRIYHSPCVMDRGEGNQALCLAVRRSGPISGRELGQFEVFVCQACGYSEFYVVDPHELEEEDQD